MRPILEWDSFKERLLRRSVPLHSINVITIDPGTISTGIAIWKPREFWNRNSPTPDETKLFNRNPRDFNGWISRSCQMAKDISHFVLDEIGRPSGACILIEFPQNFATSARGVAAGNSGAVNKLMLFIGMLITELHLVTSEMFTSIVTVPVNTWKGNLPKDVVQKRIKQRLGDKNCSPFIEDVWDAVGLGLFVKDELNKG